MLRYYVYKLARTVARDVGITAVSTAVGLSFFGVSQYVKTMRSEGKNKLSESEKPSNNKT